MNKTDHHCLVLIEQAVKYGKRHCRIKTKRNKYSKFRIRNWHKAHYKLWLKEYENE